MKRKTWYKAYIQGSSVSKWFQYYSVGNSVFFIHFFIFIFYNENRITSWNSIIQRAKTDTYVHSLWFECSIFFPIEIAHSNGWNIHWIRKTGRLISWLNNMIYKHLNDSSNALSFLPSSSSGVFEIGWRIFG